MNRWFSALVLCGVVLGIAWAQEAAAPAASRTAYVNVKRVLDEYTKTTTLQQQLQAQRAQYQRHIDTLQKQVDDARARAAGLAADSAEYRQAKQQLFQLEASVKAARDGANYRIGADYASATTEVYRDLLNAVEAIAHERGLQSVEKFDGEMPSSDVLTEVNVRINARAVLYRDPALDITDAVLARLNGK